MSTKDITDVQVCQAYSVSREYNGYPNDAIQTSVPIKWPYEFLQEWTNQPGKVCYRACERAYDHGLIEYGTSLRSGWLTDKGKEILNVTTAQ